MSGNNKPKVCYIFRKKRPGFFSIERIFSQVGNFLADDFVIKELSVPYSRLLPWNVLKNFLVVKKERADVYHITGDVHYLALILPRNKTVLTIHDCVFMYRETGIKRWLLKQFFLNWPVRHCRLITTISEQSRNDIIRFTGCPPEKVIVIPNPVDDEFYYEEKEFDKQCPVLLFVGTAQHKNLARVIEALRGVHCLLDIVGKVPDDQLQLLKEAAINFSISVNISSARLAEKYAQCDILLFPSTFEGFGLPIIEAQKSGRVVITSNLSPMKEVAGKGAILVDPYNAGCIKAAVLQVIENDTLREELIKKGFENMEQFLPGKVSSGYRQQYRLIMD